MLEIAAWYATVPLVHKYIRRIKTAPSATMTKISAAAEEKPSPPETAPKIKPDTAKKKISCHCMAPASYGKTIAMSTIKERVAYFWKERKYFLDQHRQEIIFALIIFLISSLSFGLGYLIAQQNNRASIIIEKHSQDM